MMSGRPAANWQNDNLAYGKVIANRAIPEVRPIKPVVGRKKLYPVRLTLPLTDSTAAEIDSARGEQPRVDFIRQAIEREIKRRKSKPAHKPKKA